MMKIERYRFVVLRKDDGRVLCGSSRDLRFKKIEDIGNSPMRTYLSEEKARQAVVSSFGLSEEDVIFELVKETFESY